MVIHKKASARTVAPIKHSIRKNILFSLLFVTPAGFLCKYYPGPGQWWVNNYFAGLLYEIFWIMVSCFFFPAKKTVNKIPIWVFLITCSLEVLQLWHPLFLEKIRSGFIGSALIGTTFSWWDFPHYAAGCICGWLWIKWLRGKSPEPDR